MFLGAQGLLVRVALFTVGINSKVRERVLILGLPSVQPRSAAISCNIWNFLGSDLSSARKCSKWLVTICLGDLG